MAIFDLQKFSINDGPGIRTTVFFKGCPLHCLWCHNPESQARERELFYMTEKCIGCGACAGRCPLGCHSFANGEHRLDREACVACGACAEVCPAEALETVGREMTVGEIIAEVLKDEVFYRNSGGGMTVSGGEPMMQFDFLFQLLTEAKRHGLHVCMETCGFAKAEQYRRIAPLTDLFLYDYKETDPVRHREETGADPALILSNLHLLDELGANIILRCPIIPGYNDRPDHFAGIARLAESLTHLSEIDLEPYHSLGGSKANRLGKEYPLAGIPSVEEETAAAWVAALQSMTKVAVKRA